MNKKQLIDSLLNKYEYKAAKAENKWIKAIGKHAAAQARIDAHRKLAETDYYWQKTVETNDLYNYYTKELNTLYHNMLLKKTKCDAIKEAIQILKEMNV